jgi:uncharacterized membrane protein YbaN (DUF454 family)
VIGLRGICFVLGWAMLGLGAQGAVLPLLPTTPFLLAAAWFFYRSSPRMVRWMDENRVFGPAMRTWRREGAIALRYKLVACASMALGYLLTLQLATLRPLAAAMLALLLLGVALFIVTRPRPGGLAS